MYIFVIKVDMLMGFQEFWAFLLIILRRDALCAKKKQARSKTIDIIFATY